MSRTATFYLLKIEDLEKLNTLEKAAHVKKSFLTLKKKSSDTADLQISEIALEKIQYRWSGLAYTLLAVFAKEKIGLDWSQLEYNELADELSERYAAGVYIFSAKDEALFTM